MENSDIIRNLFQTLAIILFIFQFQQSVRKYFEYPIVELTSETPVENLTPPVIYICQDNLFNYKKARSFGYFISTNFMAGILMNSSKVSWNTKYGNMTYTDLESSLFEYDYSTLNVSLVLNKFTQINLPVQKTFLFPHGYCLKVLNVKPTPRLTITSEKKILLMLVDPATENSIRIDKTKDAETEVGPHSKPFYEMGLYDIHYTLHDSTIKDGITCTDYTKSENSYALCLSSVLKEELLQVYGCLPPWYKDNNFDQQCKQVDIDADSLMNKTIVDDLYDLLSNREIKLFKRCLPPCIKMEIKLERTLHLTNLLLRAKIDVKSRDWATVKTQDYSYDIFSLTVDLGSALGLWLGLSMISILDYVLVSLNFMKKYWKK